MKVMFVFVIFMFSLHDLLLADTGQTLGQEEAGSVEQDEDALLEGDDHLSEEDFLFEPDFIAALGDSGKYYQNKVCQWIDVPLAEGKTGKEKLDGTGLMLDNMFGPMEVAMVLPGHNKQVEAIKNAGVDSGWIVESVRVERDRLPKQIILIPVFVFLFFMGWLQMRRKKSLAEANS